MADASHAPPRTIPCREPSPGSPRAPRGKAPACRAVALAKGDAFPRTPFSASARNASAYIAFFTFERPAFSRRRMRYGNGFTRGLNARVHSAFCPRAVPPARGKPRSPPARSAATASQRPCANQPPFRDRFDVSANRRLQTNTAATGGRGTLARMQATDGSAGESRTGRTIRTIMTNRGELP